MSRMLLEHTMVGEIPVLTIAPEDAAACPAIFFIPGFGGCKEEGLRLGHQLARAGFFVICFDPWLHGERFEPQRDHAAEPAYGGIYPPETGLDTGFLFFRIINRCLLDVQTLLEHYAADSRADVRRCGVTGLSMGGYASYLIFAEIPAMQAAVPMIGIPQFTRRWLDIIDECRFSNPDWATALDRLDAPLREHTDFIAGIDPAERLMQAAPRALLIMNCDFDADQPKLYALNFYRMLAVRYAHHPQRIRLNIYPAGHTVTSAMEQDAKDWFCRHLLQ